MTKLDARALLVALGLTASVGACGSGDDDDNGGNGGTSASAGTSAATGGSTSGTGGSHAGSGGTSKGGSGNTGGTSGSAGRGGSGAKGGSSAKGGTSSAGADVGGGGGIEEGGSGGGGTSGTGNSGGAPPSAWQNVTSNLANLSSECGNLTGLSATPDTGVVIAGVAQKGLFASDDGGAHWDPLGTGAGSAVITNRMSSIVYDPEHAGTFWESGIYNGGGVYKTTDAGVTFEQVGNVTHNDLVSIDFTDPARKTLLVGGHEQKQTLYLSTNGGSMFDQIGGNLPADSHFSSYPLVLDAHTFLLGACGYGDGTCGVYRSEDTGDSWMLASDLPVQGRPLVTADGTIYWSLQYDGGIARGNADGTTFTKTADNLLTIYPVELPDGRILSVRADHVVVSADEGKTWDPVGETLPFKPSSIVYSVQKKTIFVSQWDCGDKVLPDAIAAAGFDYTKN